MKLVLVVDDNSDLLQIIKRILEREGFEAITVSNGDECLETLESIDKKPDLILLDIMMPGTPVAKIVDQIDDIKIAYLSAVKISESDKQNMLEQKNIVDFIPKPFEAEELVQKIKTLVGE